MRWGDRPRRAADRLGLLAALGKTRSAVAVASGLAGYASAALAASTAEADGVGTSVVAGSG